MRQRASAFSPSLSRTSTLHSPLSSSLSSWLLDEVSPVVEVEGAAVNKTKRSKCGGQVKNKAVLSLYAKLVELIGCFAELVDLQALTDTTVLQLSSLGVSPFFVENISELQLNSLRLVSNVRLRYNLPDPQGSSFTLFISFLNSDFRQVREASRSDPQRYPFVPSTPPE
jgi:hypothetical protein